MSPQLVVALAGSERRHGPAELPLEIGAAGAALPIPGAERPLAWIGLDGDELFVQPTPGAGLECNGTPLRASRWLRDGDVLRVAGSRVDVERRGDELWLRVEHPGSELPTEPPELLAVAAEPAAPAVERPIAAAVFRPRPIAAGGTRRRGSARPLLSFALLLLGFAAAGLFLVLAQSVELAVEPAPERLELSGPWPRLWLGGRVLLRPGEYRLRAERDGYRSLERGFEVEARDGQAFRFRLARRPGYLSIEAEPGLKLIVDGDTRGETPLGPLELEPGPHVVRLESQRYRPFETRVEIEGAGARQQLRPELEPLWAAVTVASQPSGAEVRLAGRVLGVTPLTTELIAGARTLELALAGYKPERQRVVVTAGEPLRVPSVRLLPADGNLVLSSDPSGAAVSVDGSWRGETPLDLYLAPGRAHAIRLSKAGHAPHALNLELAAGEARQLAVALEARLGELEVALSPEDAELIVAGESRGRGSRVLELPATEHAIEVRRDGFRPWSGRVDVRPDFRQALRVELERPQAATPPPRASVLRSEAGFELRLVQGGRFRMGASRREPGRRANEVLREVELVRPFYIATTEVSNRQFRRFARDHLSGRFGSISLETDHHPVVRVTWQQAAAYCNWLSERESLPPAYVSRNGELVPAQPMTSGYRLPSEAEWARVARYPTGSDELKYPWGAALPVEPGSGNFADASAQGVVPGAASDYDDGYPGTAPVDSFPANPLGIHNLGGNVAEWVNDYYSIVPPAGGVERDPSGPDQAPFHVIRGSSFLHSSVSELRLSYRDYGADPRPDVGFRIARYAE